MSGMNPEHCPGKLKSTPKAVCCAMPRPAVDSAVLQLAGTPARMRLNGSSASFNRPDLVRHRSLHTASSRPRDAPPVDQPRRIADVTSRLRNDSAQYRLVGLRRRTESKVLGNLCAPTGRGARARVETGRTSSGLPTDCPRSSGRSCASQCVPRLRMLSTEHQLLTTRWGRPAHLNIADCTCGSMTPVTCSGRSCSLRTA